VNRTALATHTFLDDAQHFARVERWIAHHAQFLDYLDAQLLLIDNGSSDVAMSRMLARTARMPETGIVSVDIQRPKITRDGLLGYGYTWRTVYGLQAHLERFDRIIYAESDFFICSRQLLDWATSVEGFATVWCARYRFPESAFFVLTKGCEAYEQYVAAAPWESRIGEVIEEALPWTHVAREFVGDRYRESHDDPPLPSRCDFVAQMPLADPLPEFYE